MTHLFKRLLHSVKGVALVELAMILPVLLLLVVGSLDMGSMFVRKMALANAAKAGVQYALVRKPTSGDVTNITRAVTNSLGSSIGDTTSINTELYCLCFSAKQLCTTECADPDISAMIKITVRENYTTPFFNYDWFKPNFPITESATIKLN